MNNLLKGAVMAAVVLGFSACSDTFDPTSDQEGRLILDLSVNHSVSAPANAPSAAPSRAATVKQITADDLRLTLRSTDGSFVQSWDNQAAFDPATNFAVGNYEFEASYGTKGEEGFDLPYYFGSTMLSIRDKETTPVSVTASLANGMVSIVYTENFMGYFSKYTSELQTASSNTITFTADETRAAYVNAGHVEVFANVTKPNGISAKLSAASFDVEPRHHYVVTLDVDAGSGTLNITFNSDLVEETIDIDVTDDVLAAPAPTLSAEGFTPGETLSIVEGSSPTTPVRMVATAYGEIATGVLTTSSESLLNRRWPASVDFNSADAPTLAVLSNLGLKQVGFTGIKSAMAMIDLSQVLSALTYDEASDNTSTFTFVAKDKYSKVSEPLTLTVVVEKLNLSVASSDALFVGSDELAFTVDYNGSNVEKSLGVEIANNRGTWDPATIKSVSEVTTGRSAAGNYKVTVEVPTTGNVMFRCKAGSIVTDPVTVTRVGVSVEDNEVFATSASVSTVTNGTTPEYYLAEGSGDFRKVTPEVANGKAKFSGLNPATTYRVKMNINGKDTPAASFTTEAATQLVNGDMESWSVAASESHWEENVVGTSADATPWGTNNPMTTQQGGNYAYCRISGTTESSEAHSGSKAALLRSVGWGSGNTAVGTISGKMKYADAGLLHLGASRTGRPDDHKQCAGLISTDDLDCGIAFASRPSSVSFWYKYSAKNPADAGMVEVWVKDAAGNVIASNALSTLNATAYTQVTLPLSYKVKAKAAKLYVKFLSTNSESFLEKKSENFSVPPFANLSDGKYEGSSLYIDDVVLNY